jgi:hypothetical protein
MELEADSCANKTFCNWELVPSREVIRNVSNNFLGYTIGYTLKEGNIQQFMSLNWHRSLYTEI